MRKTWWVKLELQNGPIMLLICHEVIKYVLCVYHLFDEMLLFLCIIGGRFPHEACEFMLSNIMFKVPNSQTLHSKLVW